MAVKRYNGTSWDTVAGLGTQGAAATSSSITTWVKTATGGETSLTGSSDSSTTLAYTAGQEQLFINGVLQVRGSDYTATNGTSITGITALVAGDIATVTTVNAFSVTGAVPLSTVTANGDLIVGTSAGAVGRLGIGSTGNLLTVAGGVPTWAAPAGGFVGCSVFMSADVSLSNASLAAINFDSEYYDTNSMHDNVTNNSRITIPSGQGGKYLLTANIVYQNNATGVRYFFARINGGNNFFSGNNPAYAGTISSGFPTYVCNSFVLDLAANDYVELFSFQSSGGSLNLIGGDKGETFFQISKLG
jgi:hypothetical protein